MARFAWHLRLERRLQHLLRIDPREQVIIALFAQLVFSPLELELQRGFHEAAVRAYVEQPEKQAPSAAKDAETQRQLTRATPKAPRQ